MPVGCAETSVGPGFLTQPRGKLTWSAELNSDEGEVTNSSESKAGTQNGAEELKKELETWQEAVHQGLRHSAGLEENQTSKKTPKKSEIFQGRIWWPE